MNEGTPNRPSKSANLLFRAGEHGDCDEAACMELLGGESPSAVDVLFVTFTKSPRDRLDAWKRHAEAPPANVGLVSVVVDAASDDAGEDLGPPVRTVAEPGDLTGVGIAVSEFLSAWHGDGNRTVVCFESLTVLLQYVDESRVFRFCNELTSKLERVDAAAHFHIRPGAHEPQTTSVLSSLFDEDVTAAELGYAPDNDASEESSSAASDSTAVSAEDST